MDELKVFRNDVTEWVIATSPEDADKVVAETGAPAPDDENEWKECNLDKTWTCQEAEGQNAGSVTHTFREWIALKGRCYLGTTEY